MLIQVKGSLNADRIRVFAELDSSELCFYKKFVEI